MTAYDDGAPPPPRRHLHPISNLGEPPFDPEYDTGPTPLQAATTAAEHALLGALLTTPETAATLLPLVAPADFHTPAHETIWAAATRLLDDGVIPDHPALLNQLAHDPVFQRAGGHNLLLELRPDGTPTTTAQAEHHAQTVRDAANLRRLDTALAAARHAHAHADPTNIRRTLENLVDLADTAATTFGPPDPTQASGLKDLTWILTGQPPVVPPPRWVIRTDGTALFYAGKVNGIFGDPESGKTWLAQCAIVEALNTGGTAAMIDTDHNGPDHTAARLLLLGAHINDLADPNKFRYYEPEDGEQLHAAITDVTTRRPDVLLIDSLGEIFPMLGVNTNDGDEITTAMRQVCTRPATAGSCVITIDHLPKSAEARSTGYAIGSIAKKRMIRGAYIRAEATTQPTPGGIGRVTLRIEKDTAGELRKSSGGGYAGTLVLDSQDHIVNWSIGRDTVPKNDDGTFRPTSLMEKVSRHIEDNDACSFRDIKESVTGKDKWLRDAISILVREGFVARIDGAKNAKLHHSIAPYRQTEDDHA